MALARVGVARMAGLVGWAALGAQLYLTTAGVLARGGTIGRGLFVYFGYFTILTNMLVAASLTAIGLSGPSREDGPFLTRPDVVTGIAASIALVGVAYTALLRHLFHPTGLSFVTDRIFHDVMPVFFLVYWWVAVPKERLRWAHIGRWTLYPIVYFTYALIRGAASGEYPYFFVDARRLGYARVMLNGAGLLAGFAAFAALMIAAGRWRDRPAGGTAG